MSDDNRTSPYGPLPADPGSHAMSGPPAAGNPGAAPSAPPASSADPPASATAEQGRWARLRRLLSNTRSGWIAAAALMCAVIGLSLSLATTSTASTSAAGHSPAAGGAAAGAGAHSAAGGGASNARSGPAEGGASGTVGTVSTSGFTLTTGAGEKVTVKEASSTTYKNGTDSTTASAPTAGADVVVVGTVDATTIAATQVIVEPAGTDGSAASAAAGVVPFRQGAASASKTVGQVPANYTEGEGTIVSGTTADQATKAALAAYPGGVVDRVVRLSNGEYEVHNIGTNWPHHVFVDTSFKVVGAM
jgi:hypothetical protein